MNIYNKLVDRLKSIYKDHLKAVILYGSVAKGTANEGYFSCDMSCECLGFVISKEEAEEQVQKAETFVMTAWEFLQQNLRKKPD